MTKDEMAKQIENARKVVRTWPEWKQNILVQSGRPTVSEPRKPVDNKS